jgi:NlpC/P60 family putative phage cell wall peptidase
MTAAACTAKGAALRAAVIAEARGWLGTPYRHQASCRGAGADCLGLVRGVYRALYGAEPETPPAYTPDWAEAAGAEALRDAARRHLFEIACAAALPGDVLLFRMRRWAPAKHCAILIEPFGSVGGGRIIHAYSGHAVREEVAGAAWRRRLAFAFRFPAA